MEFEKAFWKDYNWMMLAQSDITESSVGTSFLNLQPLEQRPILIAFPAGQDAIDDEDLSDEEIVQISMYTL